VSACTTAASKRTGSAAVILAAVVIARWLRIEATTPPTQESSAITRLSMGTSEARGGRADVRANSRSPTTARAESAARNREMA
jgi:hypothetical protein